MLFTIGYYSTSKYEIIEVSGEVYTKKQTEIESVFIKY